MLPRNAVLGSLVAIAATACATASPSPPPPPGIRIVSGDNQSDTVHTILAQPIVLEVRGPNDQLAANATVALTAQPADRTDCVIAACARIYFVVGQEAFRTLTAHTDAAGRLPVIINTGEEAGPATFTATATEFGYAATGRITISAGAAVGILAHPHDSAAYVGNGYSVNAALVDRFHNHLAPAVSYATTSPAIGLDAAGHVTGSAIGRAMILLQAGGFTDTAWVTVPPRGTFAAYDVSPVPGSPTGVVKVELDGSGYKTIAATAPSPFFPVLPTWAANGRDVLFHDGQFTFERLYAADTTGGAPRLLFPAGPTTSELWGKLSGDGQRLYFVGRDPSSACPWLWSSRADGSGANLAGGPPDCSLRLAYPAPSPDGTKAVVTSDRDGLTLVDRITGQFTPLGMASSAGEWSPDGSLIAAGGTALTVMNADGSGRRTLGPAPVFGRPSWSPDQAWLLYRLEDALELINVTTGQRLPLGYSTGLQAPAWHPAP